jgi:hypothetical protein
MLLQRKAQTLDDRLPEPSGVRRPNEISLGCRQPNRVQATSALDKVGLAHKSTFFGGDLRTTRLKPEARQ